MIATTFTGKEYLMIDVANNFGLDKEDWDVRIQWVKDNDGLLESKIKEADEPALYYASVKALRLAQLGEPVSYPISLDATSSGMQILACLTGDSKAAKLCNVIHAGKRSDAYKELYLMMLSALGQGRKATIKHKDVKQAVMTSLYGSEAVPREVFGEGTPELAQFYKTMETEAPAVWELNTYFLNIWDPKMLKYSVIMPDNFHMEVKVMNEVEEVVTFLGKKYAVPYKVNMPVDSGRSIGANITHEVDGMLVREMTRRCDFNPIRLDHVRQCLAGNSNSMIRNTQEDDIMVSTLWDNYQQSGFLSARILDHIGPNNVGLVDPVIITGLLDSMPKKPFHVLSIHDCFRFLANYGNDLRQQYQNLLVELAKSEMLSYILSQLQGKRVSITKYDPDMWKQVQYNDYALT